MNAELLFSIFNFMAMISWLVLILVPNSRLAKLFIRNKMLVTVFAVVYSCLIVIFITGSEGGFDNLEQVQILFQNPYLLLAGWLHYLAFDLFVGITIVEDAQRQNIAHLVIIPSLLLTFLFGPMGLLSYYGIRLGYYRKRQQNNDLMST